MSVHTQRMFCAERLPASLINAGLSHILCGNPTTFTAHRGDLEDTQGSWSLQPARSVNTKPGGVGGDGGEGGMCRQTSSQKSTPHPGTSCLAAFQRLRAESPAATNQLQNLP